jgi:alkanesulfonate monooxygenase SsuD/methylene tetrahydromethanopterin reductase-like flavin-dependent oxidoreductase (luciferase family)
MEPSELRSRLRGPLRVGLWLDFRPAPGTRSSAALYKEHVELASLADGLGFSAVFTTEHHGATDDYLPSPIVCLAAIAARTERALLGTGMALSPLWPTRILAEEFAVLDLLSNGRTLAGLGLGYADFDFQAMRVDRRQRARILDTQIAELRACWGNGDPLSDGRALSPTTVQSGGPPLMLGGDADAALRRVAQHADVFFGDANFDYRMIIPKLGRLLTYVGQGQRPAIVLGTHLWVCEDPRLWRDELAPAIAYQLTKYHQWQFDEDHRPTDVIAPDQLDGARFLVGTPDVLVSRLVPLLSAMPIDCVCFWGRPPGVSARAAQENVERLAREVMPRVIEQLT